MDVDTGQLLKKDPPLHVGGPLSVSPAPSRQTAAPGSFWAWKLFMEWAVGEDTAFSFPCMDVKRGPLHSLSLTRLHSFSKCHLVFYGRPFISWVGQPEARKAQARKEALLPGSSFLPLPTLIGPSVPPRVQGPPLAVPTPPVPQWEEKTPLRCSSGSAVEFSPPLSSFPAVLRPGGSIGPHPSASGLRRPLPPLAFCPAASGRAQRGAAPGTLFGMEEVSRPPAPGLGPCPSCRGSAPW